MGFGAGAGSRSVYHGWDEELESFRSFQGVEVHLTLLTNQGAAGIVSLHNSLAYVSL